MSECVETLTTEQIKAALAAAGIELAAEQLLAFQEFLAEVRSLENARAAVEMLARMQQAA